MESRGCKSWRETVNQLIREDPRTFQKELRGSFCGALLVGSVLELFTNQSGEKTIYYTRQESLFSAASHNNILTAYLKEQNIPIKPDLQAHRELLATGSILHGGSPFQCIRRKISADGRRALRGAALSYVPQCPGARPHPGRVRRRVGQALSEGCRPHLLQKRGIRLSGGVRPLRRPGQPHGHMGGP